MEFLDCLLLARNQRNCVSTVLNGIMGGFPRDRSLVLQMIGSCLLLSQQIRQASVCLAKLHEGLEGFAGSGSNVILRLQGSESPR